MALAPQESRPSGPSRTWIPGQARIAGAAGGPGRRRLTEDNVVAGAGKDDVVAPACADQIVATEGALDVISGPGRDHVTLGRDFDDVVACGSDDGGRLPIAPPGRSDRGGCAPTESGYQGGDVDQRENQKAHTHSGSMYRLSHLASPGACGTMAVWLTAMTDLAAGGRGDPHAN
jgi:hypothetical protein